MASLRSKLLVGLVASAVGFGASVAVLRGLRREDPLVFRRIDTSSPLLAAEREVSLPGEGVTPFDAGSAARTPASGFRRRPLSADEVKSLLRPGDYLDQLDPVCYYRPKPNRYTRVEWKEHPLGYYEFHTNAAGLRDDLEVEEVRPDLSILVIGDSHTDGVCSNAESFAHLAEAALGVRFPGHTIRAHNAARGGYSFYHYLGVLEQRLPLAPDVLVLTVYGGNDFEEALTLYHLFQGTTRPPGYDDYWREIKAAADIRPSGLGQAFVALKYFEHQPGQIEVALQAAREVFTEIHVTCLRFGIRPLVLYVPSVIDAQPQFRRELIAQLRDALKLTDDDLQISDRMATSFLDFVHTTGVDVVDLRPAFRAAQEPLYWELDLHLNVAGHRLAAEALTPAIAACCPPTAARVRRTGVSVASLDPRLMSPGYPVAPPNEPAPPEVKPAPSAAQEPPVHKPSQLDIDYAAIFKADEPVEARLKDDAASFQALAPSEAQTEVVRALWPQVEFDPKRYTRWQADLDVEVSTGDAPWRLRTDAVGLRRSRAPVERGKCLRVLFCGDEQIAGACASERSLAGATERHLNGAITDRLIECLDAATPGHFFDAYVAAFDQFAPLAPNFCVVVVNGGNDFLEALPGAATAPNPKRAGPAAPAATELEFLKSMRRFAKHPRDATLALRHAVGAATELAAKCNERQCKLIFVYVPPAIDVPSVGAGRNAFSDSGLEFNDWHALDRLGSAWINELRARGIRVADLRPLFRRAAEPSHEAERHILSCDAQATFAELLALEIHVTRDPVAAVEASSSAGGQAR